MNRPWETEEFFKRREEARKRFPIPPTTHFDWIKSLSETEMANVLTSDWCEILCGSPPICEGQCEEKMVSWLKTPLNKEGKT